MRTTSRFSWGVLAVTVALPALLVPQSSGVGAEPVVPVECAVPGAIVGTDGDDILIGTNGDDIICGLGGADTIDGGNGDDIIVGGAGADQITGGNGNDVINAGDGNNAIVDKAGDDEISSGSGDDQITDQNGNDVINAGDGNNTVLSGSGDDIVESGSGDDVVESGSGDDVVESGGGDDWIDSGNGNDQVYAGSGLDFVDTGNGSDYVDAGDGDDEVVLGNGNDVLLAGEGNDTGDAGNGRDVCYAAETVTRCEDEVGDTDSDGDEVSDLVEFAFGTNPRRSDTDGDGLTDLFEITFGGFVHDGRFADSDGDGIPDGDEDADEDGLTALEEQQSWSDPLKADADGDELVDGDERLYGTDSSSADTDGDGLLDLVELQVGTDPTVVDTDGDGVADGLETFTTQVAGTPTGLDLALTGMGNLNVDVEIVEIVEPLATAQAGPAFEIELAESASAGLEHAEISVTYDPASVQDPSTLALFWFDDEVGTWVPAQEPADQRIDVQSNRVTATVDHFSLYALFDRLLWEAIWTQDEPVCDAPGSDPVITRGVDVALVIDSSGSMRSNDRDGLRKSAAISFIEALGPDDEASVIDFDSFASIYSELSSDQDALRLAVGRIDSSGLTNIGRGVRAGLDTLSRGVVDTADAEFLVLLTDGVGNFDSTQITRAIADEVVIFTIGLGSGTNATQLRAIAEETGGRYFAAADAAELQDVFGEISEETNGDRDGDGLSDCEEINGWRDGSGRLYTSDPALDDTDGDFLSDGEEAGTVYYPGPLGSTIGYRRTTSDPKLLNSDSFNRETGEAVPDDPIFNDYEESQEVGSDPLVSDSDGDGLADFGEWIEGTNPALSDTDGDGYSDLYEQFTIYNESPEEAAALDLNPLIYDSTDDFGEFTRLYVKGFSCGEIRDACPGVNADDVLSMPYLVGSIASGFGGPLPDARDLIASVFRGDLVGIGVNAIGFIPLGGDLVSARRRVVKAADAISELPVSRSAALIKRVSQMKFPKSSWNDNLVNLLSRGALKAIRDSGMSDDALRVFITKGGDLNGLRKGIEGAAKINKGAEVVRSSKRAEAIIRSAPGFQATGKNIPIPPTPGLRSSRVVDAWNPVDMIALEVKSGFQCFQCLHRLPNGRRITIDLQKQIDADVLLRNNGTFAKVEWHFFANTSGVTAYDPKLFEALDNAQIPYVLHLP